jgi:hypothetical protein
LCLSWIMIEEARLLGHCCGLHVVLRMYVGGVAVVFGWRTGLMDGKGAVLLHSERMGEETPRDLKWWDRLKCCLYFPRCRAKVQRLNHPGMLGRDGDERTNESDGQASQTARRKAEEDKWTRAGERWMVDDQVA